MRNLLSQFNWSKTTCKVPEAWDASPQGRHLCEMEHAVVEKLLAGVYGYFALQLGTPHRNLLKSSPIANKFIAGRSKSCDLACDSRMLPFESSTLDVVVLSHALEFSSNPETIMRESFRCLRPEGQLLIIGFNPGGLFGVRRHFNMSQEYPWHGDFIFPRRVRDWLDVLGATIRSGYCFGFAPPWYKGESDWLRDRFELAGRRWWPLLGGVYITQAIKRVPAMQLMKTPWKSKPKKVAMPVSIVKRDTDEN